jgi:hypothetical protein
MEIDTEKIDETVLALLYLTLHDGTRAWKGFDWDTLNRLHAKGLITDPVDKAKSVVLTNEGLRASERGSGGCSPTLVFVVVGEALPRRSSFHVVPFSMSCSSRPSTSTKNRLPVTKARMRSCTSSRRPMRSAAFIVCEYAAHTSAALTS